MAPSGACGCCNARFTTTLRRHRCRACDADVCDPCSRQRVPLEGHRGKQRVCRACFRASVDSADSSGADEPADGERGSTAGEQPVSAVSWQRNSAARRCFCCDRSFGALRRKHHCRACGHVVCDGCSRSRERVADDPDAPLTRVCDRCSTSGAGAAGRSRSRSRSRSSESDGGGVRHTSRATRKKGEKFGVDWQHDSDGSRCAQCDAHFTARRRRHHCRRCGGLVCARCSRSRAVVEGSSRPQRACDGCMGVGARGGAGADDADADDDGDGPAEGGAAWTDARECARCEARFGALRRRHHCRACGHSVCNLCSRNKQLAAGSAVPVRVCDDCTARGNSVGSSRASSSASRSESLASELSTDQSWSSSSSGEDEDEADEEDDLGTRLQREAERLAADEAQRAAEDEAAALIAEAEAEAARLAATSKVDISARVEAEAARLAQEERAEDLERRLAAEALSVAEREAVEARLEAEVRRMAEAEAAQEALVDAEARRLAGLPPLPQAHPQRSPSPADSLALSEADYVPSEAGTEPDSEYAPSDAGDEQPQRPLTKKEIRALVEAGAELQQPLPNGRRVALLSDFALPEGLDPALVLQEAPTSPRLQRTLSKRQVRALVGAGGRLKASARQRRSSATQITLGDFFVPEGVDAEAVVDGLGDAPAATPGRILAKREIRALLAAGATVSPGAQQRAAAGFDVGLADLQVPAGVDVEAVLAAAPTTTPRRPVSVPPVPREEEEEEEAAWQDEAEHFRESLEAHRADTRAESAASSSAVSDSSEAVRAYEAEAETFASALATAASPMPSISPPRSSPPRSPEEQLDELQTARKRATSAASSALDRLSQGIDPVDVAAAAAIDSEPLFRFAAERVKQAPRASDEDKLALYAFYKQATQGDCNTSRPGVFKVVERAKWDRWHSVQGLTVEEARQGYMGVVDRLDEGWRSSFPGAVGAGSSAGVSSAGAGVESAAAEAEPEPEPEAQPEAQPEPQPEPEPHPEPEPEPQPEPEAQPEPQPEPRPEPEPLVDEYSIQAPTTTQPGRDSLTEPLLGGPAPQKSEEGGGGCCSACTVQ